MAVQHGYPLTDEDGAEQREGAPQGGEGVLEEEGEARGVVHFEAVGHPTYTCTRAVGVGEDYDLRRVGGREEV